MHALTSCDSYTVILTYVCTKKKRFPYFHVFIFCFVFSDVLDKGCMPKYWMLLSVFISIFLSCYFHLSFLPFFLPLPPPTLKQTMDFFSSPAWPALNTHMYQPILTQISPVLTSHFCLHLSQDEVVPPNKIATCIMPGYLPCPNH